MQLLAQIISIIGMITAFISFQYKENKKLFVWLTISGVAFSISYFMLGAFTGGVLNVINIARGLVFGFFTGKKRTYSFWIIAVALVASTIVTYTDYFSVLTMTGHLVTSFFMWKGNCRNIRMSQFFVASPIWLLYNICVFNLGGIICECFNLVSVLVSLIRFGWNGFEER